MTDQPHSALHLTDARDLWWNADYLALLARRAELSSVRQALVEDVHVWLNDRCTVYAPGSDRRSRVELIDDRRLLEVGPLGWSLDDTRRFFVAGGGDEAAFEPLCQRVWRIARARLDGLESGRASQNEGGLFYVLCGRRRP